VWINQPRDLEEENGTLGNEECCVSQNTCDTLAHPSVDEVSEACQKGTMSPVAGDFCLLWLEVE